MNNLDLVEAARGGPFTYRHDGQIHTAEDPAALNYQLVLAILHWERLPEAPPHMAEWKQALLFERWQAHYDLPDFDAAQRLAYLIDHYRSALVHDLQTFTSGADLGKLWRGRRWRYLLDLIDHLPGHSWYSAAVAGDEEHAKMIAEAMAQQQRDSGGEEKKPSTPPMHTWTPEVAKMTEVLDAVRQVCYILVLANHSGKGAKPTPPEPSARPYSPLESAMAQAYRQTRQQKHEDLTARLLPHKAASKR